MEQQIFNLLSSCDNYYLYTNIANNISEFELEYKVNQGNQVIKCAIQPKYRYAYADMHRKIFKHDQLVKCIW